LLSTASNCCPTCTGLHVSDIKKYEVCNTKLRLETQAFSYMRSFFLDCPESGGRKQSDETAQDCSCTPLSQHLLASKALLTRSDTTKSHRAISCRTLGSVLVNVANYEAEKQKPKVCYLVNKIQLLAPRISLTNSAHNPHSPLLKTKDL
jgi:CRISPR/Cas system-associated exonuclease Cas4 (RecB family)